MKSLTRFHRYLSVLVAPAMLFFAISGAWQAFRFQDTKKDGSYQAPWILETLSHVHKAERLKGPGSSAFRAGEAVLAALFALTALAGITMAFRVTRPVWLVWLCLALGVLVPVGLAIAGLGVASAAP